MVEGGDPGGGGLALGGCYGSDGVGASLDRGGGARRERPRLLTSTMLGFRIARDATPRQR